MKQTPLATVRRLATSLALAALAHAQAPCGLHWQPGSPFSGPNGPVYMLLHHPSGDVFAGGFLHYADGEVTRGIARWDGTAWHAVGGGLLMQNGGGDGAALVGTVLANGDVVVSGSFNVAGNTSASNLARWDGNTWHAFGSGLDGQATALRQLANGDLVVAGWFQTAGGVPARIARWNGTTWTAMDAGFPAYGNISALLETTPGIVLASGAFPGAGGNYPLLRWNGTAWTSVAAAPGGATCLLARPNGDVWVGGNLANATVPLAAWDGSTFTPIATPVQGGLTGLLQDGTGAVWATGGLQAAGSTSVARFDGTAWTAMPGAQPLVRAITTDATGAVLVGGETDGIYDSLRGAVRRATGSGWQDVGAPAVPLVLALQAGPDGDVIAGGEFAAIGGVPARNLARWRGGTWSPLGPGVDGRVTALAVGSDGRVVAGGEFTTAGGLTVNHIASWNGSQWSALGAGVQSAPRELAIAANGEVLATFLASGVQRWNGATWTGLLPFVTVASLASEASGDVLLKANNVVQRYHTGAFTPLGVAASFDTCIATAIGGRIALIGSSATSVFDGTTWSTWPGTPGSPLSVSWLPDGSLIAVGYFYAPGTSTVLGTLRGTASGWSNFDGGTNANSTVVAAAHSGDVFVAAMVGTAGGFISAGLGHAAPNCPATAQRGSPGCGPLPLALAATTWPWAGASLRTRTSDLGANSLALLAIGAATTPQPLPFAASGCTLAVTPITIALTLPVNGTTTHDLSLPNVPNAIGFAFCMQAVDFDGSGAQPVLRSSNVLDLIVGGL